LWRQCPNWVTCMYFGQVDTLPLISMDLTNVNTDKATWSYLLRIDGWQSRLPCFHELIIRLAWGSCICVLKEEMFSSGRLESIMWVGGRHVGIVQVQ